MPAERERLLLDMEAAYRRGIEGRAMSAALTVAEAPFARRVEEAVAAERSAWVVGLLDAAEKDRATVGPHACLYVGQLCKRIDTQQRAAALVRALANPRDPS